MSKEFGIFRSTLAVLAVAAPAIACNMELGGAKQNDPRFNVHIISNSAGVLVAAPDANGKQQVWSANITDTTMRTAPGMVMHCAMGTLITGDISSPTINDFQPVCLPPMPNLP